MAHDGLQGVLPSLRGETEPRELPMAAGDQRLVLRPFVGELVISYVVEDGDSVRALSQRDLLSTGMNDVRLHSRAVDNLARHVETVGIGLRPYGSMMAVTFDGDLEATLMLYPTLWSRLSDEMGDELMVAVPARDVLAVAPADSREGIAELHAVIERVWPRDDHPLTTEVYQFAAGIWSVWDPSPTA